MEEKRRRQAEVAAEEKAKIRAALAESEEEDGEYEEGLEGLEQEAGQQGAFNPETGEINWDCPCLGGMADGPCGPEFKAAFSCFVYSTEEPKGVECIDKFKYVISAITQNLELTRNRGMQDCFRQHPEMYASELEDDEDEVEEELRARENAKSENLSEKEVSEQTSKVAPAEPTKVPEVPANTSPKEQMNTSEIDPSKKV